MSLKFKGYAIPCLLNGIGVFGYKSIKVVDLSSHEILFESNHVFSRKNEQICVISCSSDQRFIAILTFTGKIAVFELIGKAFVLRFCDNKVRNHYASEGSIVLFDELNQSLIVSSDDTKNYCTKLRKYSIDGVVLEEASFNIFLTPTMPHKNNSPYVYGYASHTGTFSTEGSEGFLYRVNSEQGLSITKVLKKYEADAEFYLNCLRIHSYSDHQYIGFDGSLEKRGFYMIDSDKKTAEPILILNHLEYKDIELRIVSFDPMKQQVVIFGEWSDQKIDDSEFEKHLLEAGSNFIKAILNKQPYPSPSYHRKLYVLKCDLQEKTVRTVCSIDESKVGVGSFIGDYNDRFTALVDSMKASIELLENT